MANSPAKVTLQQWPGREELQSAMPTLPLEDAYSYMADIFRDGWRIEAALAVDEAGEMLVVPVAPTRYGSHRLPGDWFQIRKKAHPMGTAQTMTLRGLVGFGAYSRGCGWVYADHYQTRRALEALEARGLVYAETVGGATTYRPTDAGLAASGLKSGRKGSAPTEQPGKGGLEQ